jgi:hypothetical protein
MISVLTLSVCFLAAPAEPTPAAPQPAAESFAGPDAPGMLPGGADGSWHAHSSMDGMPGANPYSCPHCWHRGPDGRPHVDWLISPCNMSQHYPYWPKDHGYYYFRPYNMVHVSIQRDVAASWGEDPRNPYAHAVFDRVYSALNAEEAAKAEVLPPSDEKKTDDAVPPPAPGKNGPEIKPVDPFAPGTPGANKQGAKQRTVITLRPAAIKIDTNK